MLFCYRIKPSKLRILSNQFKRCYFQIPGPCLANHAASHARMLVLDKPISGIHASHIGFANRVRFFAAPVQAKPKQEEKDGIGPRLNEQITGEFVRLVTDEGHSVLSRREALERARSLELDLVEVQRNAKPPVCKLMDFHKEKYKLQIKEKDRAKSKSEVTLRKGDCKEVRFSGKTEQKDLQMKADMVKRLMERGYRVKCTAMGTEEQDLGGLLSRLSALIEDISVVESGPRLEKRQAYVIVRHAKFGPSKKGSIKKPSKIAGATSPEVQNVASSPPIVNPSILIRNPIHSNEIGDSTESGLETEDESHYEEAGMRTAPSLEIPDKDPDKKNPTWSDFHANDDFDSMFEFGDDTNFGKSTGDEQMKIAPEMVSSPANSFSDFMHSRPLVDSTNTVPSSSSEALMGTENRNGKEPRNVYPPTKPMDPRFPNQDRRSQFGLNASPSTRETKVVKTDPSRFGSSKLPANDFPKQEQLHPRAPGSPPPGYGIFSASKINDTSRENGVPAEANNRYRKENTFESTRRSRPRGN